MATLRIKRRRNATKTINTEIETQAKDRIAVNREIAVSAATKVITSNKIMETLTVKATIVTQEADPVTITTKGKETKTETETTTDKININKAIKSKTTATPNADTTPSSYQE
jgi:tRNA pseudouridine-54 N-methylase